MLPVNHVLIPLHAKRGLGSFGVLLDDGQLKFPTIRSDSQEVLPKTPPVTLSPAGVCVADFGKLSGIRTLGHVNHQGVNVLVHMAMMPYTQTELGSSQWLSEGALNSMIYKGEINDSLSLAAYSLFLLSRAEFGAVLTE